MTILYASPVGLLRQARDAHERRLGSFVRRRELAEAEAPERRIGKS
jgi:hypothetical protein